MHCPESVLQNWTHKIIWDFEIQMDCAIPADHRVKLKEIKKMDKDLDLTRGIKRNYGT